MKTAYMNYGMHVLNIEESDIDSLTCSGDCTEAAREAINSPYLREQLNTIPDEDLVRELSEYGAWDDDELQDREDNEMRLVWVLAGSIADGAFQDEEE
jgi:hypothetical protein